MLDEKTLLLIRLTSQARSEKATTFNSSCKKEILETSFNFSVKEVDKSVEEECLAE